MTCNATDSWNGAISRTIKRWTFCVTLASLGMVVGIKCSAVKRAGARSRAPADRRRSKGFHFQCRWREFRDGHRSNRLNGGPDRPYNQFYAAIKTWGRYEIVSYPTHADLVLEISWVLTDTGLRLSVLGQLRLVVIDPKTHVTP
jgi:hypothetical protein